MEIIRDTIRACFMVVVLSVPGMAMISWLISQLRATLRGI